MPKNSVTTMQDPHDQFKSPEYPGVDIADDYQLEAAIAYCEANRDALRIAISMFSEPAALLWGCFVMHKGNPTRANERWLVTRYNQYTAGQGA